MGLYHYHKGFPHNFNPPLGLFLLEYSSHAKKAARRDRYGDLTDILPAKLNTDTAKLIEVKTGGSDGAIRLVYRLKIYEPLDLVLVVSPVYRSWRVITVWANESTDNHCTLRSSQYETVV